MRALEGIQIMQQLGSDSGIGARGESVPFLRPGQTGSALDRFAPQGAELFEHPQGHSFFVDVPGQGKGNPGASYSLPNVLAQCLRGLDR